MFTLKQILMATTDRIKQRARNQCFARAFALPRAAKHRKTMTKSGGYLVEDESGKYREFKFQVKCTDGWRKTAVRFYGPLDVNTQVWCWCSCPYFKYHCEVALARKGSSSVVQSNGQRPRFTNPRMEPRCCKHVYLAFVLAMRRRNANEAPKSKFSQALKTVSGKVSQAVAWAGDRLRHSGKSERA